MILVVYAHVCHFCLGDSLLGFNATFFLFRMPCFFMISGWLFEPVSRRSFWATALHKLKVQMVPTVIFLLLLAPPPVFFHQLGTLKGGYWFTFVLFEFFIIYMLSVRCCRRWGGVLALLLSTGAFWYATAYDQLKVAVPEASVQRWLLDAGGLLSVSLWRYYLYFYIGTRVRRHYEAFKRLTDRWWVTGLMAAVFLAIAQTPHTDSYVMEYLRFYGSGITGMLTVLACFRKGAGWLRRSGLSKPLEYVGTRTLDIYMIHFFLLPRFLMPYGPAVRAWDCSLLAFGAIMGVSLVVLMLTLAVSYLIRLNPWLGHHLLGVKYNNT